MNSDTNPATDEELTNSSVQQAITTDSSPGYTAGANSFPQLAPPVQTDYKDALEALVHMRNMGSKWSNSVAIHNALRFVSETLHSTHTDETEPQIVEEELVAVDASLQRSTSEEETVTTPTKDSPSYQQISWPASAAGKEMPANSNGVNLPGGVVYCPVMIASSQGQYQQQGKKVNDKEQLRKASHNVIERRRREKINELIQTLATLVPACHQRDGLNPTRSACSKVIILEKTISHLQNVAAENDSLKQGKAARDKTAIGAQAMQNQISVLEKENEFLHKKLRELIPSDCFKDTNHHQQQQQCSTTEENGLDGKQPPSLFPQSISTSELAELKALEMIRKLLQTVHQGHGGNTRVYESLKQLSVKKKRTLQHANSNGQVSAATDTPVVVVNLETDSPASKASTGKRSRETGPTESRKKIPKLVHAIDSSKEDDSSSSVSPLEAPDNPWGGPSNKVTNYSVVQLVS